MNRAPKAGSVVTATEHYDALLAAHYTWMSGGFAEKMAEQRALLVSLGLAPVGSRRAVDLGCGSGFQSVALSELGYQVTALDTSRKLLAELQERKGRLPITLKETDLQSMRSVVAPGLELVVCMGDTLTHLPSKDAVSQLFADVRQVLEPGGKLVLSYRDLSVELIGTDRFIPVRSDADRIMTCFLEYEPETVIVHDLIHIRDGDGWSLRKSSYRKLRLSMDWVSAELTACDLLMRRAEVMGRLAMIVAERAPR